MPAPRIPRAVPTGQREPRDGMSTSHLAMVRLLPCLACGASGCEAHHLLLADPTRGMSRKAADRWAIPVDRACHAEIHRLGYDEAMFTAMGIDARAVASALWAARGDQDRMERIVFRARQTVRAA